MVDLARLQITVDTKTLVAATQSLRELPEHTRRAAEGVERLQNSFQSAERIFERAFYVFSTYQLARITQDIVTMAARYDTLGVAMNQMGANAGYTNTQMEAQAASVQKAGIAMIEARENVGKLVQAQIDLSKASQLARVAQDAAVVAGLNSSETYSRMIHGIQSGQPEILRTLGINISFAASYEKLAARLNLSADALNEYQKMQARANAVIDYGNRLVGTYEASMGTAGKQLKSFERYVDDFKVKLGEAFQPAFTEAIFMLADRLRVLTAEVQSSGFQDLLKGIGSAALFLADHLGTLVAGIAAFLAVYTAAYMATKAFNFMLSLTNPLIAAATAVGLLIVAFMELRRAMHSADDAARGNSLETIKAFEAHRKLEDQIKTQVDALDKWNAALASGDPQAYASSLEGLSTAFPTLVAQFKAGLIGANMLNEAMREEVEITKQLAKVSADIAWDKFAVGAQDIGKIVAQIKANQVNKGSADSPWWNWGVNEAITRFTVGPIEQEIQKSIPAIEKTVEALKAAASSAAKSGAEDMSRVRNAALDSTKTVQELLGSAPQNSPLSRELSLILLTLQGIANNSRVVRGVISDVLSEDAIKNKIAVSEYETGFNAASLNINTQLVNEQKRAIYEATKKFTANLDKELDALGLKSRFNATEFNALIASIKKSSIGGSRGENLDASVLAKALADVGVAPESAEALTKNLLDKYFVAAESKGQVAQQSRSLEQQEADLRALQSANQLVAERRVLEGDVTAAITQQAEAQIASLEMQKVQQGAHGKWSLSMEAGLQTQIAEIRKKASHEAFVAQVRDQQEQSQLLYDLGAKTVDEQVEAVRRLGAARAAEALEMGNYKAALEAQRDTDQEVLRLEGDRLSILQSKIVLGQATTQDLIAQYELIAAITTNEKARLDYQVKATQEARRLRDAVADVNIEAARLNDDDHLAKTLQFQKELDRLEQEGILRGAARAQAEANIRERIFRTSSQQVLHDWTNTSKQMDRVGTDALGGVAQGLQTSFEAAFSGTQNLWGAMWAQMKGLAIRILAEIATAMVLYGVGNIGLNLSGSFGGGGAGGIGSLLSLASGAKSAYGLLGGGAGINTGISSFGMPGGLGSSLFTWSAGEGPIAIEGLSGTGMFGGAAIGAGAGYLTGNLLYGGKGYSGIGGALGGAAGGLAGGMIGAGAIGQALIPIPGVGFVVGSVLGGILGGAAGGGLGSLFGNGDDQPDYEKPGAQYSEAKWKRLTEVLKDLKLTAADAGTQMDKLSGLVAGSTTKFGGYHAQLGGVLKTLSTLKPGTKEYADIVENQLNPAFIIQRGLVEDLAGGMNKLNAVQRALNSTADALLSGSKLSSKQQDQLIDKLMEYSGSYEELNAKMQRYNEIRDQLTHANKLSKEEIKALVEEGQGLYKDLGLNNDAMSNLNETIVSLNESIAELAAAIEGLPSSKSIDIYYNRHGSEYHTGGLVTFHEGGLLGRALLGNIITAHGGMYLGGGFRPAPGPGEVDIRAMLGEYVVRKSAVDKYGVGFMDAVNSGTLSSTAATPAATPAANNINLTVVTPDGRLMKQTAIKAVNRGPRPRSLRVNI